ncbi:MAG: M48 family metallopeptidase, partial [Vulcanimicrobiaceae bacterium]
MGLQALGRIASSMVITPQAPAPAAPSDGRPLAAGLFAGSRSLRVRGERVSFVACCLAAPLTLALVGIFFPVVSLAKLLLLAAGALVFVTAARGRLLGSSVRVDERQLPEIAALVREAAARLGIEAPQIFVRDDPFVPIVAVGTEEPYALVISSQYLEHLRERELAFLIARELGHIAAGHTRLTSLLSISGRENPAVAIVFGAWLRRTEYTADRIGLVCAPDLEAALGAVSITTFHAVGRRIDLALLAEQGRDLRADLTLRSGEWVSGMPFATGRIAALRSFADAPLAAEWERALALGAAPTAAA